MRKARLSFASLGLFAALAVLAAPATARAASLDEIGGTVFDALLLRPAGVVKLALGGVSMVTYPIVYWSGQRDDMTERLVTQPFEYLFRRPLGDF